MLSYKVLVFFVVLPYLVSCMRLVYENDCCRSCKKSCITKCFGLRKNAKSFDSSESDEDSSEEMCADNGKRRGSVEAEEEKTWLVVPMNGLGVPNYGGQDLRLARLGQTFAETSRQILQRLKNKLIATENILPTLQPHSDLQERCPFRASLDCDPIYPYRNADGSCNNFQFPYYGKSSTPFVRYLPAVYSDGINAPRNSAVIDSSLPSARVVSTNFHSVSAPEDCQYELVHLTSLFGIFLGHDLFDYQAFPILENTPKEDTDCCKPSEFRNPIDIPESDYYFGLHNRTCMDFRRSLSTPHITCTLGAREQLNRATGFIDASQLYGSDLSTQMELRTMTGGLMRTTPTEYMDLLPQMDTYCTSPENNLCFLGGDSRVNLHPLITTQYTLFVREHNRLANLLGATYPDCSDEILFQEARKFLIAEFQHIANNEFLPNILGSDFMEAYNLWALQDGHSSYLSSTHPGTRNGFASAAFLFAHSGVMGEISINGSQVPFGSLFYNPDIFYNVSDATTILYEGLTVDLQEKIDRFMTDELTNKLSETKPGDGWDLAAINIQSGRDNGLPAYNTWRHWCGLDVAENFTSLVDHKDEDKESLQQIYECVEDIDLWTAGISEIHVPGGSVGPTFACIIARQFQALKFGDRFWYESAGRHQLPIDALNAIRNVSISRLICDNTDIDQIQINAFRAASDENPVVPCTDIPCVDECALVRRYSEWSSWSACADYQKSRSRVCTAPTTGTCSCADIQPDIEVKACRIIDDVTD